LNDSWLKKEDEDNKKTGNLQKGEGQEQGIPSFNFMTFCFDKHVVLQIISSSSEEHISSIFILQMDAACSAKCCCPTTNLHFNPTSGTEYFLKILGPT
jgi:hypothetical protein